MHRKASNAGHRGIKTRGVAFFFASHLCQSHSPTDRILCRVEMQHGQGFVAAEVKSESGAPYKNPLDLAANVG